MIVGCKGRAGVGSTRAEAAPVQAPAPAALGLVSLPSQSSAPSFGRDLPAQESVPPGPAGCVPRERAPSGRSGLLFCVRDSLLTSCLLTGTSFLASCRLTTNTFQLASNARRCGRRAGHRLSRPVVLPADSGFQEMLPPISAVGLCVRWFSTQTGPHVSQRGR